MRKISPSVKIILKNVLMYTSFLFLAGIILAIKSDGTLSLLYLKILPGILSDSVYSAVFIVLALLSYFAFLSIIGAAIAFNNRRYFSNAEIRKFTLYLLSIIPPIVVSKYFIQSFEQPVVLAVTTIYITASFLINYLLRNFVFRHIYDIIKKRIVFCAISFVIEILIFYSVFMILYKIESIKNALPAVNLDDLLSPESWYAKLLFIIVFNCINYISVEYISSVFSMEMKKAHVKNYLLYKENPFERFLYIVRASLSMILGKVKLYLAWFVSFIILFEMNNNIFSSIGSKIMQESGNSSINRDFIFSIFVVIYLVLLMINTIMDIFIFKFRERRNLIVPPGFSPGKNLEDSFKNRLKTALFKHRFIYGFLSCLILLIALTGFAYSKSYIILQYYDFLTNQKFSMDYLMDEVDFGEINKENINDEMLGGKLCKKDDGLLLTTYRIARFTIKENPDSINTAIPVFETTVENPDELYLQLSFIVNDNKKLFSDYSYILNNKSLEAIDYNWKITVPRLFSDMYIPFNLERNSSMNYMPYNSNKLLFPIVVYYLFHFFFAALLLLVIVFALYRIILIYRLNRLRLTILHKIVEKTGYWLKTFIISTPFILIISFSNIFFPNGNMVSGRETIAAFIPFSKDVFANAFLTYGLFTLMMTVYIAPGIVSGFNIFMDNVLGSMEIKYLSNIGICQKKAKNIISKKYGNSNIMQVFIENFLFLFVLQFFIMYCYMLPQFTDISGVGSVLSVENILTKVYRSEIGFTPIVITQYVILFVMYIVIYGVLRIINRRR